MPDYIGSTTSGVVKRKLHIEILLHRQNFRATLYFKNNVNHTFVERNHYRNKYTGTNYGETRRQAGLADSFKIALY